MVLRATVAVAALFALIVSLLVGWVSITRSTVRGVAESGDRPILVPPVREKIRSELQDRRDAPLDELPMGEPRLPHASPTFFALSCY